MIEGDLIGGLADIEEQLRSGNANHAALATQLAQILQALTNMPAAQVTVQPAARLKRGSEAYHADRETNRVKQNAYAAATRDAKRAYDAAYQPIKNARRRAATAALRAARAEAT